MDAKTDTRGYGPIEEEDLDEEPTDSPGTDLPDPGGDAPVDSETQRRLKEATAAERRRLERAEAAQFDLLLVDQPVAGSVAGCELQTNVHVVERSFVPQPHPPHDDANQWKELSPFGLASSSSPNLESELHLFGNP